MHNGFAGLLFAINTQRKGVSHTNCDINIMLIIFPNIRHSLKKSSDRIENIVSDICDAV